MRKVYWTRKEWISSLYNFAGNKVHNISEFNFTIPSSEPHRIKLLFMFLSLHPDKWRYYITNYGTHIFYCNWKPLFIDPLGTTCGRLYLKPISYGTVNARHVGYKHQPLNVDWNTIRSLFWDKPRYNIYIYIYIYI